MISELSVSTAATVASNRDSNWMKRARDGRSAIHTTFDLKLIFVGERNMGITKDHAAVARRGRAWVKMGVSVEGNLKSIQQQ